MGICFLICDVWPLMIENPLRTLLHFQHIFVMYFIYQGPYTVLNIDIAI